MSLLNPVTLDDKYSAVSGSAYMSGTQVLVRLLLAQAALDKRRGIKTGGYVSGYRGSPLGGFDNALWQSRRFLDDAGVKFEPGLNEDLAATAVWGTQMVHQEPTRRVDGVFAMWYGKGPGLDRSMDVFKHGNYAGSSPLGGVLAVVGDDPGAFSSTTAHQGEFNFEAAAMPIVVPADPQEMLGLGLAGWALSRYAGVWTGMKVVSETVETSGSIDVAPPAEFAFPERPGDPPPGLRWPEPPLETERKALTFRLERVKDFVFANGLDRVVVDTPDPRLLIVTCGKAWHDLREALRLLGLDEQALARLGVRVLKLGVSWPVEPRRLREAAHGVREILVIEEKRAFVETQVARILYGTTPAPILTGKTDPEGRPLLPETGMLGPVAIASALVDRLRAHDRLPSEAAERLAVLAAQQPAQSGSPAPLRTPYFCSGCPHNTSTKVPEGSHSMAGIGCHGMAFFMPSRAVVAMSHMGGEGLQWVGLSPFVEEAHRFQNMGDGTYAHSGSLCIRAAAAAAAAGTNITYKILVNDAVAMTGGQPIEGDMDIGALTRAVAADGVKRIAVVADAPDAVDKTALALGTTVHHRDDLDSVQRGLREVEGVSVLVYVQVCAAEKRRRRKKGTMPQPEEQVFINPLVCEGCGDCSTQSNCVAVVPQETPLGRKRRIDQNACNEDLSCLKGFCPSFVTVSGGIKQRAKQPIDMVGLAEALPQPALPAPTDEPWNVLVTGIGGTGVVTIGALLGMAAHLEGKAVSVLDIAGLAQKNGGVTSHVRIAAEPGKLAAARIAPGSTDLLLAADIVVALSPGVLPTLSSGRTRVVLNEDLTPTSAFIGNRDIDFGQDSMQRQLESAASEFGALDAVRMAQRLLGDAVGANLLLLGYAWQRGHVPLSLEAIEEAVRLNGVAVEMNLAALAAGRIQAHDPGSLEPQAEAPAADLYDLEGAGPDSLEDLIARHEAFLTDYQNQSYARRYRRAVDAVRTAEAAVAPGENGLARTAAKALFKLMAYKDEYEVARLWSLPAIHARLAEEFGGKATLKFHMAPPLLARRDPDTGHLRKGSFGQWMMPGFKVLARLRFLRGTAFDPFGRTAERRMERAMIAEYEQTLGGLTDRLSADNHTKAMEIAALPLAVRGYGHVKEAAVQAYHEAQGRLLAEFSGPTQEQAARKVSAVS